MSIYYIQTNLNGNKIFSLDSTSSVEVQDNGRATSYALESGKDVADHYVNSNVMVSFSGIITDIKSATLSQESTKDFLRDLRELKQTGTPFTVFAGNNLEKIDNCVIQSLSIKQNSKNGTVVREGKHISSFVIEWTAKQIKFGSKAKITTAADVIKKTVAPEQDKAGQKQEITGRKKTVVIESMGNLEVDRTSYNAILNL